VAERLAPEPAAHDRRLSSAEPPATRPAAAAGRRSKAPARRAITL